MTSATPVVSPHAEWLSRKLAATYMSVSVKTIDRWARSGRIKRYAAEPGSSASKYKRSELDDLMQVVEPPFDTPRNLDPEVPNCEHGYGKSCGCTL
jgi:hypothetical protein